jgi:hypothetical protein
MKSFLRFTANVLLTGVLINLSCKKEYSCENCGVNSLGNANKLPIAIAGPDQTILLPTDSIMLDGSASSDPDGTISSFEWIKISGPASFIVNNASAARTVVKNLVAGVYQFELKVTDNGGLSAKDTMRVIVNDPSQPNRPPVANAGPDQSITLPVNSVNLDGSGSTDPDNNIISYAWTKVSGPSSFNIVNAATMQPQASALVQGTYQFELKVTDARALFSKDTMQVTVNAVTVNNIPPVARAGNDTTIQSNQASCNPLPTGITLNGSNSYDLDGTIVNYLWTGPGIIANPNMAITTVNGLMPGISSFILKVTDNNGASAYDTVQITIVLANRPQLPAQLIPFGTLSQNRYDLSVASAGNKILFAGGSALTMNPWGGYGSTRVDIYDLVTQSWSIAELSIGRSEMAVAVSGNKIFFAGGTDNDGNGTSIAYSNVDIYDASTNSWSVTYLSVPNRNLEGGSVGNKVFFAGGNSSFTNHPGPILDIVDIYDLSTNSWSSATLSEARENLSVATAGNKIYFAGGEQVCPFISKQVDIYDNVTGSWSAITLNEPKTSLASIAFGGKIYWAGGVTIAPCSGPGMLSNQVEIYDVNANNSSFDCLFQPNAWNYISAVEKNGKLVFFTQDFGSNKFDIYDVSSNSWSIGVLPQNFAGVIISVNNIIYVSDGIQVWKLNF